MTTAETMAWRLVVQYGPERTEIASVHIASATEDEADEIARALLTVFNKRRREEGWEYGVSIRMDQPVLPA